MSPLPQWSSKLLPIAAIVGASFVLPVGGVAFSIATGVAGNLSSLIAQDGTDWCYRRLLAGDTLLNHDLQKALQRAFDKSLLHLEKLWTNGYQHDVRHGHGAGQTSPESVTALFRDMRNDGKTILTDERMKGVVGSAEAAQRLDRGELDPRTSLNAYLTPYLDGHGEQLVAFFHKNFAAELACRFGEELKGDDQAWRAFQRLVNDSLLDGVRAMNARQDMAQATLAQLVGLLEAWGERLQAHPPAERDRTGEAGLETVIAAARDEVIAAMAEQFGVTRAETRGWFDETWDLLAAEFEMTRAIIREEHDQTRDDIAGLRLDLEQFGLPRQRLSATGPTRRRVFEVPHFPNPHLVGRDDLLDTIATQLSPPGTHPRVAVLWGLGGVGKTQAAVAYAYRRAVDTDIVWWLQAQSAATIAGDYVALARALDLPEAGAADQREAVNATVRWMERTDHSWLLIFDNAERQDVIRPHLPGLGNGQVLITSTSPVWGALTPLRHEVKPLERGDAADFLQRRRGDPDRASAEGLADALGGLPLALAQAAAYMETTGASIARYLELFSEHRLRVLEAPGAPSDHHLTVAATWDIALQRVREGTPVAIDLLALCAFLAPQRIPLDLLAAHSSGLGAALVDSFAMTQTVGALHAFSLVEVVDDRTITVHRLVQEVVRERLTAEEFEFWLTTAAKIVNAAFPFNSGDHREWETCARLLGHAQAVTAHEHGSTEGIIAGDRLLNQMGIYLRARAQFGQARTAFERALVIKEAAYGPDHPTVATGLGNLAGVLRQQGDLAGARERYERALAIDEGGLRIGSPRRGDGSW